MTLNRTLIFIFLSTSLLVLVACTGFTQREGGPDGDKLYALHCSACHGKHGRGGVGVPLALEDFLDSVDDNYLRLTIKVGRPGRVMPAFPNLNDEEIDAIVATMRGWVWSREPSFSDSPIEGDIVRGKQLYIDYCSHCHGRNGEGGKGTGLSFSRPRGHPILAPALNNPGFLAAATDEMIQQTLILGRSSTPMRSFTARGDMTKKDINDLVAFVRSFASQPVSEMINLTQVSDLVIEQRSSLPYEQTVANIREAIEKKGFSVVRERFLEEGLVASFDEDRKLKIIYFTSFNTLNDALARDPRLGLFQPSRFTVMERDGVVKVIAVDPRQLSLVFNNIALKQTGEALYRDYLAILEEAAL